MIKQYVKRPIVIRAVKWTGYNFDEIAEFVKGQPLTLYKNNFGITKLLIENTRRGYVRRSWRLHYSRCSWRVLFLQTQYLYGNIRGDRKWLTRNKPVN